MVNVFYLAADARFLVFYFPKPMSAFTFGSCILAIGFTFICVEFNLGQMLIIFALWIVFNRTVSRITVYNFVIFPYQLLRYHRIVYIRGCNLGRMY